MTEVNVLPVRVGEDRMKQQVIERLAAQGHLQGIQNYEVEGDHVAGMMNLWELDLLFDTVLQLPALDASFERSADRIAHPRLTLWWIVFLLEPIQNRIGLEPRIVFQKCCDFIPELRERILPCAVGTIDAFDLAGQLIRITILPHRLRTHLQPPCDTRHRFSFMQ